VSRPSLHLRLHVASVLRSLSLIRLICPLPIPLPSLHCHLPLPHHIHKIDANHIHIDLRKRICDYTETLRHLSLFLFLWLFLALPSFTPTSFSPSCPGKRKCYETAAFSQFISLALYRSARARSLSLFLSVSLSLSLPLSHPLSLSC
jgi:hypothetical protein